MGRDPRRALSATWQSVLYLGMIYYLFNEFRELASIYSATGSILGYFSSFWNVIDWALIFLSFTALGMPLLFVFSPEARAHAPPPLHPQPSDPPPSQP